ncbi:amino acid transporter [Trametes versicolor FP-101664 SS1]|uniref:amino acid transporter n=1 Tax=Trametes versicolor (strain FP-101664) TaxID=717944 RepID=UPI00046221DF|nr:amino acid transporter [Trametes versicolor FP-101664 SS1]EIW60115.1 amino acid transporter [Trametes versicolor FP-101664 SS1]
MDKEAKPRGKSHIVFADVREVDDLKKLGYEQELARSRGLPHILFSAFAILASFPYGLGAPIATSLVAGGPVPMFWGLLLVSLLSLFVALSLGEIASKYPTSAGAYYWCYRLAPPRHRLLISYITGWLTVTGDWMVSLSVTFGTAQLLVAGINIYHPEWEATAWQTYLIFLGMLVVTSIFCVFFNRYLPMIDILSAYWIAIGLVVMLVCLSVEAKAGRHSAEFAFTHFDTSFSGWTPGWAFFIGLFPAGYTFSAIGMTTSMAEEVHNPSINLPRAIVWSVPIGCLMGIAFILPINFTLPDTGVLLEVASGQPIAVMYTLIMGSRGGGFGMWFIIFGVGIFCAISINCAASRATWSFARDKAIPFYSTFAKVDSRFSELPLNAFLLCMGVEALLGLIFLGSSAAFNAFVGVEVMCLGASYAIPIIVLLAGGRKGVAGAPYPLGNWGWFINVMAILWVALEMVLFSMPAALPVDQSTMNYASVVFVGFAAISAVWYMISGRFHYRGPPGVHDTDVADADEHYVKA